MPDGTPPSRPEFPSGLTYEAMSRFHAGLAHDLNNRLTTILGNLLLFETLYPDEQEALSDMRYAAEQACALVRLVQTFSKRDVLPLHPVNVREVLKSLQDLLQRLLGPPRRLTVLLPEDPVYTEGDEGALESLLAWLVGASEARESVCLELRSGDDGVELHCDAALAGGAADSSVQEAVAAVCGTLVMSECGWCLRLPACELETGVPPEAPLPAAGLRVLLAEGDPALRGFLAKRLREAGFAVSAAADVLQVRAMLESEAAFGVAALDPALPGGGGEALQALSRLPEPAQRVWMTPCARTELRLAGTLLPKPFGFEALHRALLAADSLS